MTKSRRRLDTILAHSGHDRTLSAGAVNTPVIRASTRLYPDLAAYEVSRNDKFGAFRYGRYGTPTTFALEEAVAELEGGYRSIAVPSGLAAISATLGGLLRRGDELLMVDTVYGPARSFCDDWLAGQGITTTYYDPLIGTKIESLIEPRTRVIYCESPGSLTFEVQDITAIAEIAHRNKAILVADNTWATPFFHSGFDHGVDVSIHAATKYIVGHSDAMLGLIVTNEEAYQPIRAAVAGSGMAAAPDDCWLGLRGLRTLGVRLRRHQENALKIARWLAGRQEIKRVLYPALEDDPGHSLWKRQFTGASGLFGVELNDSFAGSVRPFIDGLKYFGIGSSWGGYESLVIPVKPARTASARPWGQLLRFHIGLEDPDDLIADLNQAFERCPL